MRTRSSWVTRIVAGMVTPGSSSDGSREQDGLLSSHHSPHYVPLAHLLLQFLRKRIRSFLAVVASLGRPHPPTPSSAFHRVPSSSELDLESQPLTSPSPSPSPPLIPFLNVELSPDTVAIALVYFVQGVLGLARLAVTFFLKDHLQLDPSETAVLTGFSSLPWLVKPIYGFMSDGIPLFGYRRRSYLVLCGIMGAASWMVLAAVVKDKYSTAAMILLGSLSVAVSDVVVDSMVVERVRGQPQSASASFQSLCWGAAAVGSVLSSYSSGSLVEAYGPRFVFAITSVLPLITSAVGFLIKEQRITSSSSSSSSSSSLPPPPPPITPLTPPHSPHPLSPPRPPNPLLAQATFLLPGPLPTRLLSGAPRLFPTSLPGALRMLTTAAA